MAPPASSRLAPSKAVMIDRVRSLGVAATLAAACGLLAGCATVPRSAPPGTVWLLFVDDLHLDFRNTGRLRNLLKIVVSELIHEGDVFAIRSSGPSMLSIDLTSDRTLVDAAIKRVAGNGLRPSDIIAGPRDDQGPKEVRYRATIALAAAHDMIRSVEHLRNRRKAFIYISNGYDIEPPPAQLAELPRVASRTGVRIFAIDPRAQLAVPDLEMDAAAWQKHLATTRDGLRRMSGQTRGFALVDKEDLVESLKRISSAMRN